MMYLLEIKNKQGLTLNRGITIDHKEYLERFNKLHTSINNYNECIDIELIQINVSYDSLYDNRFLNMFDIEELKQIKFIPVTRHLYKILKYNY